VEREKSEEKLESL